MTSVAAPEPSRAWLVVSAHPHKERVAIENLERQGFETYCPLIAKRIRHARQRHEVRRPLFPGYLFVRAPGESLSWRPMMSTRGVRSVVRVGDQPGYVDERFVAALRAREIDGVIVAPAVPFEVGQTVRLADDVFSGHVATILEIDEKDRITVLMDLLCRPTRIKVDARRISPV